ncbi:Bile pigment transporter 1 [Spathaspora sp. JA1]|nr:Bile pigment transporter 1 [Spathaspora sp. JA1]
MVDFQGYPELTCGLRAFLHPMAPSNDNAFNPCFLTLIFTIFGSFFILYGGITIYQTIKKPHYGTLLPSSTGMSYYIRLNSIVLQAVLLIYLQLFISIHDRLADAKLISFTLVNFGLIFIILPLHIFEVMYVPVACDVLILYWPVLSLFELALYFQDNHTNWRIIKSVEYDLTIQIVEMLAILNSISIFVMEYSRKPTHELISHYIESGQSVDEPNLIQRITFSWMNELIMNSYKNQTVTNTELPNTPIELSTSYATNKLGKSWYGKYHGNLTKSLLRSFGWGLLVSFAYELCGRLLNFVQPQFLRFLILYFDQSQAPILKGGLICMAMFGNTLLQTSLNNEYMLQNLQVGLNCRSSLTCMIYEKSLKLSSQSKLNISSGDIINLMSVDVNRIQNVLTNLSTLVLAPIDIVLCIVSLWPLLGKTPTFAGIFTMIGLVPINAIIIKYSKRLNKTQMKLKDTRSRIINDILVSIKSIKLYAWEKPMLEKLSHARNQCELKNLRKIRLINQGALFIWNLIPFLVSFVSFTTFALTRDIPLTSDIVFPALALLNLLSSPLLQLPMVITSMIEASVAITRVRDFLISDEIDESMILRLTTPINNEPVINITNANFHWTREKYSDTADTEPYTLKNINFSVNKGELSCIVGKVGSGKTSFLHALLGQLIITKGNKSSSPLVSISGSIAYCSQQPWIMNASVKENILFGCRFDDKFYQETISACQLLPDLAILPDGDDTQVGEKGVSLSGGQRARLALARAVYARADVYLLDDILSAVDSHVGNQIIELVLTGLLRGKCIILCTNNINVLNSADMITLMEKGEIIEQSTTIKEINELNHPKLSELINNFGKQKMSASASSSSSTVEEEEEEQTEIMDIATSSSEDYPIENLEKGDQQDLELIPKIPVNRPKSIRRASIETFHWDPLNKLLPNLRMGQANEISQQGKVQWSVYLAYIKACSIPGGIFWLFLLLMASGLSVAGNYWLKHWTEQNSNGGSDSKVWMFIVVYGIFGLSGAIMTVARGSVMMLWLGMNASKKIHDNMANQVVYSPMIFFEKTPMGRIMNRFTNDINKIDDGIPQVFQGFIAQTVKTILTLAVVSYVIPMYIIIISILGIIYYYYEIYYVSISRELKRLVSISRSPIYGHLGESLSGIDTIRAYQQFDRFEFINQVNIDFNLKSVYMLRSINRWLFFRLQFIGAIGVLTASSLCILSLQTKNPLSSSMAGFVMTYALQVTSSLKLVVRTSAEVETSIVAVERCLEYMNLPIEETETPIVVPETNWPTQGNIIFNNYSTRYRSNLDLILKNISMSIKPGEKIGIVGRTGAGKSSLALAIFRIIEPVEGNIEIDLLNTNEIPLYDLRNRLSIIPQDCQLIEGTIRENLDPFESYTDEQIWHALELAHLKDHIYNLKDQLLDKVYENGINFSSGQRQLISLARVLLKINNSNNCKILILDEATAAVDVQTDKFLQETIRQQFHNKTIITIAHRLETVMDSDKIVSLDQGELIEFDSPKNLLEKKQGIFYNLCKEGGYI